MKTIILPLITLVILTGCQTINTSEDINEPETIDRVAILSECDSFDEQLEKNICLRYAANKLKDETICESIIEDFSHLTDYEKERMDANVSIKIDCIKGVALSKYFSPENCETIEYELERDHCFSQLDEN